MKEYNCICGQSFVNSIDQNEHILTHFDQKNCIGCDNQLIFVAGRWYQPHNDLDCNPIKIEPEYTIQDIPTPLDEHMGEYAPEIPNIELVEIPAIKEECFDEELVQNKSIENADTLFILANPFECDLCQRRFKLKSSVWRHRKKCITNGESPTENSANQLTQSNHGSQLNQSDGDNSIVKEPTKSFECEFCHKQFQLKSSLQRHVKKTCKYRTDEQIDASEAAKSEPENFEKDQPEVKSIDEPTELKDDQMLASDIDECDVTETNPDYYFYVVTVPEPDGEPSQSSSATATNEQLNAETSKNYACTVCSARFKSKKYVKLHYQRMHVTRVDKGKRLYDTEVGVTRNSDGRIQCKYCPTTFSHLKNMRKHKRLYHRDRLMYGPIKCTECPATFQKEASIRQHMRRKHNALKDFDNIPLVCYMCQKACRSPKELVMHLRTHPNIEYKCCVDGCGNQCETYTKLYLHLLRHVQIKCKQCGRLYTRTKFENHQCKTDSSRKSFICDHCGKAYTTIRLLGIHMNGHTGKRPFKCDVCDKSFKEPTTLRRHRNTHFGISPLKCGVENCDRAFNQHIDLYRHRFKAHGIFKKKHPCTLCDQVFPENSLLRKHLANHENV